ncbi:hypothetical protein COCON_G00147690 [Conger conger]|uniref:Uncharacterized protein n=1 Tax=Conger conger TaxID=82655 RepID=A0A9Q1HW95_CONCO|nr:hypothetical protein COCON_G00147690 [Conger conger]
MIGSTIDQSPPTRFNVRKDVLRFHKLYLTAKQRNAHVRCLPVASGRAPCLVGTEVLAEAAGQERAPAWVKRPVLGGTSEQRDPAALGLLIYQ